MKLVLGERQLLLAENAWQEIEVWVLYQIRLIRYKKIVRAT